jgi:hypothetical protein
LPPPYSSILTGVKEILRDRSLEIKQKGRNHGNSCPKERYGQKSFIDIDDSETEQGSDPA